MNRNRILWLIQGLLALVFLLAGVVKLVTPADTLAVLIPLPTLFVRFIGVCEALGGLGLVLPWLLGIRRQLTPLAASGLVVIMAGAVVLSPTVLGADVTSDGLPLVLGLLAASVAYGRREFSRAPARQPRAARASA
ncbi:MAG: DoxX family protein [Chloroflexi bacterium]|nr:DoxX family protein [Chloroflexota bacterium]